MLNQEKIDAIAGRVATIECFEIVLTQNKSDDPLIFSGPGCLFFDNEKTLKVKLYSESTKSDCPKMMDFFGRTV